MFAHARPHVMSLFFSLLLVGTVQGQWPVIEDAPKPYKSKKPLTRQELNRRESLHQYALGLLCEREDRLIQALRAYEEAARLDPEAAAVFKAQAPILVVLDRVRDAQAALRKTLALDPADQEAWFMAARLHKGLAEFADARTCLERGLKCPAIADQPQLAQQMYLELGQLHEATDDIPRALEAFRAAAKILDHPDLLMEHGQFDRAVIQARAAETHEHMGGLHRRLKKFDDALSEYKKAQALAPDRAGRLNFNVAQLCLEQGKLAEALPFLDAYLRMQPSEVDGYEMRIDILRRLGKANETIPWLEKAARADANNIRLKTLLARQYVKAGQATDAENAFKALADESPSVEVYLGLLRLYQGQRDGMKTALTLINTVMEKADGKGPAGMAVQQAQAIVTALDGDADLSKELVQTGMRQLEIKTDLEFKTIHLLGILADRHRKLEEAERFYRALLPNVPRDREALVYSGLLRVYWKARKYEAILEVCKQGLGEKDGMAIAQGTRYILFYDSRTRALAALGRLEEALKAADRAVALAADNERRAVRSTKVQVLMQAEKYELAEAECKEMLKEFRVPGDQLEVRYLLSNVYSAQRKHDESDEQLQMILKVDPDNAAANNNLGYGWADRNKNLAEAEAMIRRALDADRRARKFASGDEQGDNASYVDSLGWVLFRRGRLDEARRELERAAKLDGGEDPTIFDHLGDVYSRLDRSGDARTAWEKALRLYQEEKRRKIDDRQKEVERKLKALK